MTDKEKLQQFTKDEIIRAVLKVRWYGHLTADDIVKEIRNDRRQIAFEIAQQARQHSIDCMNKYFEYEKELVKKYGNGERAKIGDIPHHELQKWAELGEKWKKSEEARKKAEKEEDRYC